MSSEWSEWSHLNSFSNAIIIHLSSVKCFWLPQIKTSCFCGIFLTSPWFHQIAEAMVCKDHTKHVQDLNFDRYWSGERYKIVSNILEVLGNTVKAIISEWRKWGTTNNRNRSSLQNGKGQETNLSGKMLRDLQQHYSCSVGMWSGLCPARSSLSTWTLANHAFDLILCTGELSCWNRLGPQGSSEGKLQCYNIQRQLWAAIFVGRST